jgi:pimeloyl-ACP methyl ester carboxylesterase
MDRPYGFLWPLSAFSLASLTRAAPKEIGQQAVVQVVQLDEVNDALPVLTIRSDGLIRSLGPSESPLDLLGKKYRANGYELTTGPIGIPHAKLVEFPDLGHAPQIQAPERFHKALLEGLQAPSAYQ